MSHLDYLGHTYTKNSILTGCPVFLLAKSGEKGGGWLFFITPNAF